MCTSTNCQVTFARKTGVNFPPLWSSVSTPIWGLKFQVNKKNNMWFIVFGSPVYMMLRLFFTAHNGTYLWLILRVFCFLFYDWGYFQDVVPLLIQAKKKKKTGKKKYCFYGIWKWVNFKAQIVYPNGGKRHTKDSESKCIHHLILPTQSAKSQTTQAPSNITEKSAMACCRRTSRVQLRNRLGWECLARSRLSGFLALFCLVSYMRDKGIVWHFISWLSKILSQRAPSTQRHL